MLPHPTRPFLRLSVGRQSRDLSALLVFERHVAVWWEQHGEHGSRRL